MQIRNYEKLAALIDTATQMAIKEKELCSTQHYTLIAKVASLLIDANNAIDEYRDAVDESRRAWREKQEQKERQVRPIL